MRCILSHTLKALRYEDAQVATSALELKVNLQVKKNKIKYRVVKAMILHTGLEMLGKARPTVGAGEIWNQGMEG